MYLSEQKGILYELTTMLFARIATRRFLSWLHLAMLLQSVSPARRGTKRHDAREHAVSYGDEDEREEISHTRHVSAEAPVDPLNVIIRPVAPAELSHVRR